MTDFTHAMPDKAQHTDSARAAYRALARHDFDASGMFRPNDALWVDEVFVHPKFGNLKIALDGATYEAFIGNGVKGDLDWQAAHPSFDEQTERWNVDAQAITQVHDALAAAGHALLGSAPDDADADADPAFDIADALQDVTEDADLTVTYETKKAGTEKEVAGSVRRVVRADEHIPTDVMEPADASVEVVIFDRHDDGHEMHLKATSGDEGLFTTRTPYPYVGTVTALEIETDSQ